MSRLIGFSSKSEINEFYEPVQSATADSISGREKYADTRVDISHNKTDSVRLTSSARMDVVTLNVLIDEVTRVLFLILYFSFSSCIISHSYFPRPPDRMFT